ncbi:hypothetical protein P7K49_017401 [Saguinus oedipus]|uniref:Uncharacterized protein n=1 Tax=Saguinus oedipus TaxID=9490 RepID=A0ABQ9V3E3_SAGOE|nr:hypothetical protein P7K49_017401 [Saguinus oedipus]
MLKSEWDTVLRNYRLGQLCGSVATRWGHPPVFAPGAQRWGPAPHIKAPLAKAGPEGSLGLGKRAQECQRAPFSGHVSPTLALPTSNWPSKTRPQDLRNQCLLCLQVGGLKGVPFTQHEQGPELLWKHLAHPSTASVPQDTASHQPTHSLHIPALPQLEGEPISKITIPTVPSHCQTHMEGLKGDPCPISEGNKGALLFRMSEGAMASIPAEALRGTDGNSGPEDLVYTSQQPSNGWVVLWAVPGTEVHSFMQA